MEQAGRALAIYPNPVNTGGQLFIKPSRELSSGKLNIALFTCLGKKILSYECSSNNEPIQLDTKQLAKGWYVVKVQSGKTSRQEKVFVQ
jgi:hypothetical protein